MKLRSYSVVFFNPLILPELNGYVCVQRFRDWEKTHRFSRQFICGISAVTGARTLCKKAGMDDCILKVNSGLHVKSLVRRFRETHRISSLKKNSMVESNDPSGSDVEAQSSESKSGAIDEVAWWDGASIEMPHTKSGKLKADELDVDIEAFRRQMQTKTGDLHKFIALFLQSGQKIVVNIELHWIESYDIQ